MKILTIVGARPQFVKAAVLSRAISQRSDITEILVHTGQHYDANMSDVFFEEMNIPQPDYNLHVQSKLHGDMTGKMMSEIENIAIKENPDWILVYGDTNSTLAGALVASKLHIKLAHVEAGLRSYNNLMPEEINRILTDRVSDILFCPTTTAVENLQKEGYGNLKGKKIVQTGDIMLEASLYYAAKNQHSKLDLPSKFILCTVHRAENTDNPEKLKTIFESLNEIGKDVPVVLPIHPRTKGKLNDIFTDAETRFPNIKLLAPIGYYDMIWCLQNCEFVITDSGGLQKEAYFFKKYCLTLRDQTEWVELVQNGYNILSNIDKEDILNNFSKLKDINKNFDEELYGDGKTGLQIINELLNY
ncbi:non-hydrolyzing UDP-N-acetylglucosamine 2-epimerase [Flavobacterium sp. AG291]|uniref:non-hydrolyzing UDP-N-acetylglucosamine 2-epimerase n=1 Tax=Flavobacterium sp. AG291 TaxID=2184000 RepID=UPI000E0B480E|nr:UDP-N-acetylglucosamine 2-epimerase (non-hydrolyzing) [Flavobacterium sp. AG291]RDI12182.1 UDP-GlcNAc3NAcA epimerase [Flavobacterium sp. AG291]